MNTRTTYMRWLSVPLMMVLGFLYVAISPTPAQAQLDVNAGTTYVIAFPDTTTNTFDPRFPNRMADQIAIYIYSATDNNKISVQGNGYNRVFTGRARKFTIVDLTDPTFRAPLPMVTENNKPSKNTFRIESQTPVVVYCYIVTKFGCEAWTPIPVEFWGNEYYTAGRQGEIGKDVTPGGENSYNSEKKQFPAEILVIAAEDNTIVTILPNGRLIGPTQQPTVTLMKDEAYLVQSFVDTSRSGESQPDLAGSYITSSKPVGVISGNTRAQVLDEIAGLGKNSFKDMLIEWIAPVEQHGRQFVYMPTMDDRRPKGLPNENLDEKRTAEFVRIYASNPQGKPTNGYYTDPITGNRTFFKIDAPRQFFDHRIGVPEAVFYKTDSISQAFMNTSSVVKFLGTTGFGTNVGAKYDGWGTYMVEMTPREQWINFAPFFAPVQPANMEHFINVVTDTASAKKVYWGTGNGAPSTPVLMSRPIKGTDLVWGFFPPPTGQDCFMTGWDPAKSKVDTSVKFYAFAYGLFKGHEEYRPGRTSKKDDNNGKSISSANGGKDDEILHPSEYEEYLAVTYGYPLAPSRIILRPGDSLQIDTTRDCTTLDVNIKTLNDNPVGLRSISLDSINNAKIIFVDPASPAEIIAKTKAHFQIVPINPLKNASAIIVIRDRTNKTWRFRYNYEAEYVTAIPDNVLDFGEVTLNATSPIKEITITNPLSKDVTIQNLKWVDGTQSFEIVAPTIPPSITLKSGESIKIQIRIKPTIVNKLYEDSLRVILKCTEIRIKVQAETVKPCIFIGDLPFGILSPGESKTLPLSICNNGRGVIVFDNPDGGEVIQWLDNHFTVSDADKQKLKAAKLGPGECDTIQVTFKSDVVGLFTTTAKFYDNTDDKECKDISLWTATVKSPGPQISSYDWHERWVTTLNPCTQSGIAQYDTVIFVSNDGTSSFIVDKVEIVEDPDGVFTLDNSDPTTTVSSGLEIRPGEANQREQKVIFKPKEEKTYTAKIRLTTTTGQVVEGLLQGIGIESHVSITGFDFGTLLFTGPGAKTLNNTVTLSIKPTRATTITDMRLGGANPGDFSLGTDAEFKAANPGTTLTFPPSAANHWNAIPINTTLNIPVRFTPQVIGDRIATIAVTGDFSKCDVPIDTLKGTSYTLTAAVTNVPFDRILTCDTRDSAAFLTNTGSAKVVVSEIIVQDLSNGAFIITRPGVPDTLDGGATLRVPVQFVPGATGNFTANITFVVTNLEGDYEIGRFTSNISGDAFTIQVNAHILKTYEVYPGTPLDVPVTLDGDLDQANINQFYFYIRFNAGMMSLRNATDKIQTMLQGTLVDGWLPKVEQLNDTSFAVTLTAPPGAHLKGTGTLLNLNFLTYIGNATSSDLPFEITLANRPCATVVTDPGAAKLKQVCGLNLRLIEASASKYSLSQNAPNPFNPSTDIHFSVGLDAQTTLTLYNANGEKVGTLVDQYLQPGEYTVTWDASAQPSGMYYYRLQSGMWTKTNTMILRK